MSSHRLTLPYRSGWFTVLLPTLITLGVWGGLVIGIPALLGWNIPGWLGTLLCLGGFLPGLVAAVVTYPLLLRLAERGRGEVLLEGNRLRWRSGWRWQQVDFTQPYEAEISAGASGTYAQTNACIYLRSAGQMFHLREARRNDVLELFPEPYFVDTMAVLPEEGSWGFDLSAEAPEAVAFFSALLECLWRTRQNNRYFRLYQKFPWDHRPNPAFHSIRFFDLKKEEERLFVEGLKLQAVSSLDTLTLTPDYLMGWAYRSPAAISPEAYAVMPLGFITAETYGDGENASLIVRGKGQDGRSLKLFFSWYDTVSSEWDEAKFLLRFIQAMWEAQKKFD
ncbi:MAG: hypothetical protein ACK4VW_08050 [Anaerolineales bacterium]